MYAFQPPAPVPLNQGKEETSSPARLAGAVAREGRHPRGASVDPTIEGPKMSRWSRTRTLVCAPVCFAKATLPCATTDSPFGTSSGLLLCYVHRVELTRAWPVPLGCSSQSIGRRRLNSTSASRCQPQRPANWNRTKLFLCQTVRINEA